MDRESLDRPVGLVQIKQWDELKTRDPIRNLFLENYKTQLCKWPHRPPPFPLKTTPSSPIHFIITKR